MPLPGESTDFAGCVSDALPAALLPWLTSDMRDLAEALGSMFSELEEYALDREDGTPGWAIMFDPDRAPVRGLPYLAQLVGERLPQGISEAEAREWIKRKPNQLRGTTGGIVRTAQLYLTGTKVVMIRERHRIDGTPDPDHLTVITWSSETPDPSKLLPAMEAVAPWDLIIDYEAQAAPLWSEVAFAYAKWSDVSMAYPTWSDVFAAHVGFEAWTE